LRYGHASFAFIFHPVPSMGGPPELFPAGFGYDLWVVYVVWALIVLGLYPACRWFATIKASRHEWWRSYLSCGCAPAALAETSKRRLIWLAVVLAILGARVGWVLYDRSQHIAFKPVPIKPIEKDYLTVIPKSDVTDFESAKKLLGRRLWVKAGYAAEYFR